MANRPQNWYRNNNTRLPTLDDYVLLGNLDPGDPGGPELTAAMMVQNTASFLDQVVTANTTAKPGQIVPVDSSGGDVTVSAPDNAAEGDRFGVMLIEGMDVEIDGNGYPIQAPARPIFDTSVFHFFRHGTFVWTLADPDLTGLRWMISGNVNIKVGAFFELWQVAVDTDADNAGGPLAISFVEGTYDQSVLFSYAGGILTSQLDVALAIRIQAISWITLTGNNNSARVLLDMVSTGTEIVPRLWASQGASRAEAFPNTLNGIGYLELADGDTVQLNSTLFNMAGVNLAQWGSSIDGDVVGIQVEFVLA